MRKISLIASDLDGTLLLGESQKLQPQTCNIIEQLMDRGIAFVAASGRQYPNLRRLFEPIKDKIGYVCDNGCLSYLGSELISQETMDRDLAHEIIQTIMEHDNCEITIAGKMTEYTKASSLEFIKFMREVVHYDITPVDDIFNTPEDYMKISIFEKSGLYDSDYWKEKFGDRCTVQVSGANWLDTVPKNVNKSTGFAKLLERLNIDPQDCIMFGDNDNDREILEMVGCPITMNTAKPTIRALGKYTTDTVEDVLIKILDKNF